MNTSETCFRRNYMLVTSKTFLEVTHFEGTMFPPKKDPKTRKITLKALRER